MARRFVAKPLGAALAVCAWLCVVPFGGAVLSAAVPNVAQAAEGAAPEPLRARRRVVRPRGVVRRDVDVRPVYRTNHVPGIWRSGVRLPWVGPGICHDGRTSGRVYCILW